MITNRHAAPLESVLVHQFNNHLGIVIGFCDLLLETMPGTDQRHADLQEIRKAGEAALALVPELAACGRRTV